MDTKVCSRCRKVLLISQFNAASGKADGLNTFCKICSSDFCKDHYRKNKKTYISRNKKLRSDNAKLLFDFLRDKKCLDCETTDTRVLEFDHVKTKRYNISYMINSNAWKSVLKEIENCEIVCANCHRIRTLTRENSWRIRLMV